MMRFRAILTYFCLLALPLAAGGQEAGECRDFRFAADTNPFLSLSNPAAVSAFDGHISMAGLDFRKDNGGLISLTESADSYKAGAYTESYFCISERISFHGGLSWSYFSGKWMGAQVLMDPLFNPVNFLESDEANTGTRNREDYSLLGAMSFKLNDKWALGCEIDYSSADQTKVKDPRFSNVWMDMNLKAGASFRPDQSTLLGAALIYRSTMEQIRGGIYGTTDKQYFIMADKGSFLGTVAGLSGDMDYVPMTEFRPMKNDFFGLSLQALTGAWTNEAEVLYRMGYYGKKASDSATYFEFSGIRAGYSCRFQTRSGADIYKASLKLDYELLGNYENLFSYVQVTGQNTTINYYGQNHISDRHLCSAALSFVWHKGVDGYLPELSVGASVSGQGRFQTTVLYPFYRKSNCVGMAAEAFADRNIRKGASVFSLGGRLDFRYGLGNPKEDGVYDLPYGTISGTTLRSFDNYLFRQFEYDTAPAAGAGLSFAYTRIISGKAAACVKVSDSFSMLINEPQYLSGRFRNVASVTLGLSF